MPVERSPGFGPTKRERCRYRTSGKMLLAAGLMPSRHAACSMAWSAPAGLGWGQRKRLAVLCTGGKSTHSSFQGRGHYQKVQKDQKDQKDQKGVWRHEDYPLFGLSGLSGIGGTPAMARAPSTFRQQDVTRAVKAVT